jgi:hypothetical protein
LLNDDEESCTQTLADAELPHGELEGPVAASDVGLEEGPLLELAFLE